MGEVKDTPQIRKDIQMLEVLNRRERSRLYDLNEANEMNPGIPVIERNLKTRNDLTDTLQIEALKEESHDNKLVSKIVRFTEIGVGTVYSKDPKHNVTVAPNLLVVANNELSSYDDELNSILNSVKKPLNEIKKKIKSLRLVFFGGASKTDGIEYLPKDIDLYLLFDEGVNLDEIDTSEFSPAANYFFGFLYQIYDHPKESGIGKIAFKLVGDNATTEHNLDISGGTIQELDRSLQLDAEAHEEVLSSETARVEEEFGANKAARFKSQNLTIAESLVKTGKIILGEPLILSGGEKLK